jgi:hypothetical protein
MDTNHRRIYNLYIQISVTILLLLRTAKSHMRVSQQEEDVATALIKSGHTQINKKNDHTLKIGHEVRRCRPEVERSFRFRCQLPRKFRIVPTPPVLVSVNV